MQNRTREIKENNNKNYSNVFNMKYFEFINDYCKNNKILTVIIMLMWKIS